MKRSRFGVVLVVGLARNVGSSLDREVRRLDSILRKVFDEVSLLVVESDSEDNTVKVLQNLSDTFHNFNYISLGRLQDEIPDRINRLTYCRNSYVQWLRHQGHSDYVIVVDFDIRNTLLSDRSIREALVALPDVAGIFTNQRGRYFDIYALRCPHWSERDCLSEYGELRRSLPAEKAKEKAIWSKMIKISKRHKPIEVDSAFGGFGIYKKVVFEKFDYEGFQEVNEGESEHVILHRKIRNSGEKLFIFPPLLNFGWNPHNLSSFKILRKLDLLSRSSGFSRVRRWLRNTIR